MSAWSEFERLRQRPPTTGGAATGSPTGIVDHVRISRGRHRVRRRRRHPPGTVARAHPARRRAWRRRVVNIGRAVPSFAILALALPLSLRYGFGLGFWPTLVALVALAIPPIFTNTYAGVVGVDDAVVDAARGMGMRGSEVLRRVEVPDAMPLLLTGVTRLVRTGRGHGHVGCPRRLRRTGRLHQRGLPSTGRRQAPHRSGARRGGRHRRRARLWGRAAQAHALATQKGITMTNRPLRLGSRPPRPVRPPRRRVRRRRRRPEKAHRAEKAPARRVTRPTTPPRSSSARRTSVSRGSCRSCTRSAWTRPGTRCRSRSWAGSATSRSRRSSPATSTSRRSTRRRCSSS